MKNRTMRMTFIYSALVAAILLLIMVFVGFGMVFLHRVGLFRSNLRELSLITLLTSGASVIVVGVILSRIIGRRPIRRIAEISEATKEIAKGNFDVRLKEDLFVTEFRDMSRNFNIMAKELASTELLRSDFIANVSHEFKTPLAAIEGYATLMRRKGLSEEKRLEYTEHILQSSKRLSTLVGNILLLSKLENQDTEISRELFCLDEQLRETILLFEAEWSHKELDLEIDLDSARYLGNRELLGQVWQNIIENAVKFAPHGGRVRVTLRGGPDGVRVSVSDNGPGMSEDMMKRIFEKFYQGDTSRSASGNGLGLALAKRVVDLHHGTIDISSIEGSGSTFIVLLP